MEPNAESKKPGKEIRLQAPEKGQGHPKMRKIMFLGCCPVNLQIVAVGGW
jgi:hypothetical protein